MNAKNANQVPGRIGQKKSDLESAPPGLIERDQKLRAFVITIRLGARWAFATLNLYFCAATAVAATAATPACIYESAESLVGGHALDDIVLTHLNELKIEPAHLCSDSVFVRRVYLDVLGRIPTANEAREFLESKDPSKRGALIETLLERDEFAGYWTMKWCDLLRVKAEFPINLWPNAVQAYRRWIFASIRANKPYDQFVREILTANGSNFREAPVNFFRAMPDRTPNGIATMVALTFMGARAEKWPTNRLAGLASCFAAVNFKSTGEWKEEIVFFDPRKARTNSISRAALPDGATLQFLPEKDPRAQFADWLVSSKNPWFARNIANRIWAWLMGRGIVEEPDDFRDGNPPGNPQLLAYLEKQIIENRFDLKGLYALILNSQTYQLSSIPRSASPEAAANFAYYPTRRLEAELLIDGINDITWTTDVYSSPIPEPFTYLPEDSRAVAIPDGSITSPFLEMFGRPPRDNGLSFERNNEPSPAQRVHLLNSSHIQRKIESSSTLMEIALSQDPQREIVTLFYLTILSRFPTDDELKAAEAYSESKEIGRREFAADLAWALVNSAEFVYRH